MPILTIPALQSSDIDDGYNFRNRRAYDSIHALVSEGMMVASFAFAIGQNHACGENGNAGVNCSFELFSPVYHGAPAQMQMYYAANKAARSWTKEERQAVRVHLDEVRREYVQYESFDGHLQGIAYRIQREEYIRKRNAQRQATLAQWNAILEEGMRIAEEVGWSKALIYGLFSGSNGTSGVCGTRSNSMIDRCTEDALFNALTL
ncbi:hypothetical protein [Parvularcula maris]|uniref:Uncharacterized protein n=1 Tax=Parvularcula maris TaxID=2965077 RepID=A0A9X2LA95_9PROT|nr:hypothetical protein [Parvularcula maris]MCQ8185861.1 hypothetical protein [Parvularcula maris]